MAICESCGSRYSGRSAHSNFRSWLESEGWSKLMDEAESCYDNHSCLDCNKENVFSGVSNWTTCDECSIVFHPEDEEEIFDSYLMFDLGYSGDAYYEAKRYYQESCCGNCNKESFKSIQSEFEDEYFEATHSDDDELDNRTDDPGVYRSYEDYLESGEPVDPADDALWLHDQE